MTTSHKTTVIDTYNCHKSGKPVIRFAARLRDDSSIIEEVTALTYDDAFYLARKRTTELRLAHSIINDLNQAAA